MECGHIMSGITILESRLKIEKNTLDYINGLNEPSDVKKHLYHIHKAKVELLEDLINELK